jgi:hypothetical protein
MGWDLLVSSSPGNSGFRIPNEWRAGYYEDIEMGDPHKFPEGWSRYFLCCTDSQSANDLADFLENLEPKGDFSNFVQWLRVNAVEDAIFELSF